MLWDKSLLAAGNKNVNETAPLPDPVKLDHQATKLYNAAPVCRSLLKLYCCPCVQVPIEVGLPDAVKMVACGEHHTLCLTSECAQFPGGNDDGWYDDGLGSRE